MIVDAGSSANTTKNAFFDAFGPDFPTTIAHKGVASAAGTPCALSFDLYNITPGQSNYVCDVTYALFAGNPTGATLLGSGVASGSAEGFLTLDTAAMGVESGNILFGVSRTFRPARRFTRRSSWTMFRCRSCPNGRRWDLLGRLDECSSVADRSGVKPVCGA